MDSDVITWFKIISNQRISSLVNFDVVNFSPLISDKLFRADINFAKSSISVREQDLSIITQSRKTLLFHNSKNHESKKLQMKTRHTTWLVHKLVSITKKSNLRLYRDGTLQNTSKQGIERKKKLTLEAIKAFSLPITKQWSVQIVEFLDVSFDWGKKCI